MAWRIFAVLSAAYVASQFFRVSNAVIAPELMRELSLSPEAMGTMTGVFFLAFAAAQLPAGILLDRVGPRLTMSGLLLLAVLGSLLFSAAEGVVGLTIARALMGLGCAVGLMGAMVAISRWFAPERFAPITSVLYAIGGAGSLLATTPLAAVALAVGWRGAFVGMAAVTALLAGLLWLVVRDHPPAERADGAPPATAAPVGLLAVVRNRQLLYICAIQLIGYGSLVAIVGLWGGPYLETVHGLDAMARGNVLLAMNGAVLVGTLAYGWAAPLVGSPKRLIVPGASATVLLYGLLALLPDPPLWQAAALLVLLGAAAGYFNLLHAHARSVLTPETVGRGLTLQNMAAIFGVFAWQAATGYIVGAFGEAGAAAPPEAYRAVFGFLALISICGLAVYTRAGPRPARG